MLLGAQVRKLGRVLHVRGVVRGKDPIETPNETRLDQPRPVIRGRHEVHNTHLLESHVEAAVPRSPLPLALIVLPIHTQLTSSPGGRTGGGGRHVAHVCVHRQLLRLPAGQATARR